MGSLIGGVLGHSIEESLKTMSGGARRAGGDGYRDLAALSAMLAKVAKADGRVSESEIRFCENLFSRLGLYGAKREFCIRTFRAAKDDGIPLSRYADDFARSGASAAVREIIYGVLWELASSDGELSRAELDLLHVAAERLRINPALFYWYARRYRASESGAPSLEPDGEDPYSVLGCARTASVDELRKAYRAKAKKLHPDALRAQGLSEELMSRANDAMSHLNAAWDEIKRERGIQ